MRDNAAFVFFRGGLERPVFAARSPSIAFANYNEPLQPRLSLTGRDGEMRLTWTTRDAGAKPLVRWGTWPVTYVDTASAVTLTYRREELCGPPATTVGWMQPGHFHSAVMTGLVPGVRYYYRFGDDSLMAWSDEYSFVMPPAADPGAEVRFFAFGDMGQAEVDGSMEQSQMLPSLNTTRLMLAEAADKTLVMHIGDISYARGYVSQWDAFFDEIAPLASRMAYMTNIGNHERDYPSSGSYYGGTDSGGECGVAYERRMRMPRPADDKPWYGFDMGPVHVTMMSTEVRPLRSVERGTARHGPGHR